MLKLLLGDSFRRRVAQLVSGTAFGQLVAFALLPVLGRVYTPADFGRFSAAFAVAVIVATVATGRYEFAVVPAKNPAESRSVGVLAMILAVASCAAAAILLQLAAWSGLPVAGLLGENFLLVPLLAFAIASYQTLSYWFVRASRFGALAVARFVVSGGAMLLAVALAPLQLGDLGLTLGLLAGYFIAVGLLVLGVGPNLLASAWRELSWPDLRHYSVTHRRLPGYYLPAALLDTASFYLPVVLIAYVFSTAASGQYALAVRVLAAPVAVIGVAVGQVFLQQYSALPEGDAAARQSLLRAIWLRLSALGLPFALVLWWGGESLFRLFVGQNWAEAGVIASIMAPFYLVHFVSSPTSGAYIVSGLQKDYFFYTLACFTARMGCYLLLARLLDFHTVLRVLVALEIALLLWLNYHLLGRLKRPAAAGPAS